MKKIYNTLPLQTLLKNSLWILCLLLFCTSGILAQGNPHLIPIPLEERIAQSPLIVEGEVISQKSFWDANRENIYTSNIIKVYKVFKGELQEQTLEVITEGGTVGLSRHVWSSSLKLSEGQQGIFFLLNQQDVKYTPNAGARSTKAYGSEQGMISYDISQNKATDAFNSYSSIEELYSRIATQTKIKYRVITKNKELLRATTTKSQKQSNALAPVITSFSPKVASAGTGSVLTINGTGFGATRGDGFVEFKNADDGGQTYIKLLPSDYISWSDTQIKVYVPGTSQEGSPAGTGLIRVTANGGEKYTSAEQIVIPFVYSNVEYDGGETQGGVKYAAGISKPLLQDKNNLGGYTIQYAPSMLERDAAVDGFQRAVTSWICATGVNWEVGEPAPSEKTADDDRNVIAFAAASTVGARTLARTVSRYEGYLCGNNAVTFYLKEFDMEINASIAWEYGPGFPGENSKLYDFETVMLHELGHAHQLGHVILPRLAVMHYSVEFERTYRVLSTADVEGGEFIMDRSTNPSVCSMIDPMEEIPENACRIFPNVAGLFPTFNAEGTAVEIKWVSTQEEGISLYVVERSPNGIDFEEIGTVAPTGSNSIYTFIDTDPLPFKSYYRIKVIYTGSTQVPRYSTRRSVVNPADVNKIVITPNPVADDGKATIYFLTNTSTRVNLFLYDSSGRLVYQEEVVFDEANSDVEIDMRKLAGGLYILRWSHPRASGTEKILKL